MKCLLTYQDLVQGLQALSGKSKLPILPTKNSPIIDILDSFWPWDVRNFAHLNGFDEINVFHTGMKIEFY